MTPHRFPRLVQHPLLNAAHRHPERLAVSGGGLELDYQGLVMRAQRLGGRLVELGLAPGERVVLHMENDPSTCVAILATLLAGGVFVLVGPQTHPERLRQILADSAPTVLIGQGPLLRRAAPVITACPSLRAVLGEGEPVGLEGVAELSFDQALTAPPLATGDRCIPLDLAALVYTSGTTGEPKGVMLTHQAMLFTLGSLCDYLELVETDRLLSVLPLSFTYGLYQLLTATAVGAALHLERSFTYPGRVLERLAATEATVLPGVPSIFARLVAMHRKEPLCFPAVRCLTNAAAALPEAHVPALREIFPAAALFRMYGQTECARACFLPPELGDRKPGSVGRAIPGTELLLRTPDGGPVAPGEAGILHVRGPHVMAGYWGRPEATARALVAGPGPDERVLCTHDWFRIDADGCHYFVERSDEIIKTRGEKVSPTEVEAVLVGIPGVAEAAVVGVPDEFLGQALRAHLVFEAGVTLAAKELEACCRRQLEPFKVPRYFVIETELPRTPSGKVRRRELVGHVD